ncbi:AraC-like DNA-binding protein [Bacteroides zoogleoformans]|nr:AraC family transcriptional regulator [Bacteroides zoogleoformans]TWJ13934.1 AraC-like DNA-binding protein [Bacteroides zoogleoformans]
MHKTLASKRCLPKQAPKLMDVLRMRDIFSTNFAQIREHVYLSNELAMIHNNPLALHLVQQQSPPFVINDHRLGIIIRGEGEANFNLVNRHLTAGTLLYLGPGSIVNPIRFSDDLEIMGIVLFTDFPMPFTPGQYPSAFNGQVRDFQLPACAADLQTAGHILDTLWQLIHQKNYHRPTASALVAALMHHYDRLFHRQADHLAATRSREQTIFDRFIQLVNQHCNEQHRISYYANRMCLTERYLGTVIRQAGGVTAKDWIDRALITQAKVQLRYSGKSVLQISEELNFPNPSFFSKYFKRLTGMTPGKFQKMI